MIALQRIEQQMEALFQETLDHARRVNGSDYKETLSHLNNLAGVHVETENYDQVVVLPMLTEVV